MHLAHTREIAIEALLLSWLVAIGTELLEELANQLQLVLVGNVEEIQHTNQGDRQLCGLGFGEITTEGFRLAEFFEFLHGQMLIVCVEKAKLRRVEKHRRFSVDAWDEL